MNRKTQKILALSVLCLFLIPLLAACGGSNSVDVTEGTPDQTYVLQLSKDSAKSGEVTFHVTNNASSETHEFVIVKTDQSADSLPLDADGNVDEDQIDVVDEVEDLEPGNSEDLTVNLPAGHYALICNLPDHYAQGMHADFTVNP